MSSLQDQIRDEIDAVNQCKRKFCNEKRRAHKKVKALEAELESTQRELLSIQQTLLSTKTEVKTLQTKADEAQSKSEFLNHRLVFISNPKPIKVVNPYPYCPSMGHLSLLAQDLEGQNAVASMKLELRLAPGESIKKIQPLIQHIASNDKLRDIELFYDANTKPNDSLIRLTNAFLKAIASNNCVEDITIKAHPSVRVFCGFTPVCPSFAFHIEDYHSAYPSAKHRNQIIVHLLSMIHSTIKFKVVLNVANEKELRFHRKIGNENACVFEYKFHGGAVCPLITSLEAMTLLQTLELCGVQFAHGPWERLLPSLCLLEALTELSFIDCYLEEEDTNAFQALVQTRPMIRSIAIESSHGYIYWWPAENKSMGEFLASILMTLPNESNLEALSLTTFLSLDVFLETLVVQGSTIPLRKLQLKKVFSDDYVVLARVLPELSSVKELSMEIMEPMYYSDGIFHALQQNESLLQVSLLDEEARNGIDEVALQQVDAWCQRNQVLQSLLINMPSMEGHGTFNKTLLPMLLCVAQQIPSTAFVKILMCLKFNGDLIGPCCQGV